MEQPMRVLIVGGGVIGCSIAYFLRKRNVNVIVVEKGDIGAQASGAAAGLLAPIRPLSQEDPVKTFQLAAIARFPLFVPELEDASGLTIGYQQTGTLRVLPPEKLVSARRWAEAWQKAGYRIAVLTPKEALAREPLLFPGLHGAISIADEAQVVPAQLVQALAQAARRAGAFIYDHTEVIALERSESGESIKGAWTSRGELLRCDHLVIAAGTWSAKLGEWLSVPLPIRPVRGEIVALQQPSTPLRTIIFDEGVWDEDVYTHEMCNEISSSKRDKNRAAVLALSRSRGKRQRSMLLHTERRPGRTASKKETKPTASVRRWQADQSQRCGQKWQADRGA